MEWWQVVGLVLGSSVLTKLLDVWLERKKRRDTVEDRQMAQNPEYARLEKKIDAFISAQNLQNASIRQRMEGLENSMQTNTRGMRSVWYSQLRTEALSYINTGKIDVEAKIKLRDNYADYVAMHHDDSLNKIMAEVDNLRVTAET